MSKQSLLLVDGDTRSLRVLEVSLRKAGFTVTTAETVNDAIEKLEANPPDLIVSETTFPDGDGFELRRRVRATPEWGEIPFIFLTAEQAIENKIRGLELGVDDYLTKPIYIKEIITRINILLQKRQRTRFEERRDGRTRFAGRISDMPVVDIIQTIEISRKSGVIQFLGERGKQATIYFRDGRVIDAEAGALQGEDAVYRLLTWNDGEFEVIFRTVRRREVIQTSSQGLLMEGMRRLDEWSRILEQLPSLGHRFEVDTNELAVRLGEIPDDNNRILRLIDGRRTLYEVIDASDVGDLECLQAIGRLYFEEILLDLDWKPSERKRDTGRHHATSGDDDAPTPIQEVASGPVTAAHLDQIEEEARQASGPKTLPPAPVHAAPVPVAGIDETVTQPTDIDDILSEETAPAALMGAFRPSSLRLIDEAVAAAQAIEPWALLQGLDIGSSAASTKELELDAGWGAPAATPEALAIGRIDTKPTIVPKQLVDDLPRAATTNGHAEAELDPSEFESESSTVTASAVAKAKAEALGVPEPVTAREESVPQEIVDEPRPQPAQPAKPRTTSRVMPILEAPIEPLRRDDSGLRMIGSLGRDRAEASGELRPSQIMKAEPGPETQRELITILPRRITREIPLIGPDGKPVAKPEQTGPQQLVTETTGPQQPVVASEAPIPAAEVSAASAATTTAADPPTTEPTTEAKPTSTSMSSTEATKPATGEPARARPAVTPVAEPRPPSRPDFEPIDTQGTGRPMVIAVVAGLALLVGFAIYSKMKKPAAHEPLAIVIDGGNPIVTPLPDAPRASAIAIDAGVAAIVVDAAPAIVVDAPAEVVPIDAFDAATASRKLVEEAYRAIEESKFERALELADQALKLRKTARTYQLKATALQRLGRTDDAVDAIDLAIDIYKRSSGANAPAWEQKGRILWSAKRYDEAKEAFEKVLEIDPNVKSAPQLRRWIDEPR